MFQKSTFGNTSSGFGSFSAGTNATSPFGGFKPTTGANAFGAAPAFGAAATPQAGTTGGLFGAPNTTGGLFGNAQTTAAAPAFGATSGGFGFGQPTSTGLFGQNNTSGGGLFGANQQAGTSAFGTKPAGFGFGSTATPGTSTGLFGATQPTSGLFGQQQNTSIGGGGMFGGGATPGFGQTQQAGTAHIKYNPLVGSDVMMKNGQSTTINTKHHCITCMKEYEPKSLEELRLEDYTAGRKGQQAGGMFGSFQAPQQENKLFGGTNAFGQPAATSSSNVFGGGGLGTSGFGQTNTFSFGGATQNTNATPLFGAAKPTFGAATSTGTGLFGATTQAAPAFGTATPSFGFGGTNTQAQPTSLFGAKPAATGFGTGGFGATNTTGGFGTGGFGSTPGTGLFGAKTATTQAPAFGTAAPAFGSTFGTGGFGTNTTATSGGIFGANNTLGAKPALGWGAKPVTGSAFGAGLGANTMGAKPTFSFSTPGTSLFPNATQNQQQLSFGGGTSTLGTGIGGGLGGFGTTGGLGGTSLGLGGFNNTNTSFATNNLSGASVPNVHEHILNLVARPYGDNPLFKDLPETSATAEDAFKATNPAAVKAVLDNSGYKVSTPPFSRRLKVMPLPHPTKKSLFDGLEEADPSLEGKLSLKPSRKRLVLRPKQNRSDNDSIDRSLAEQSVVQETNKKDAQTETGKQASFDEGNLRGINTDLEDPGEVRSNNSSWMGSRILSDSPKEKPADVETPRLYPDLEKEMAQVSERRASWLTTKPLRKPVQSNTAVDNSVRELRVETQTDRRSWSAMSVHDKENVSGLANEEEEQAAPIDGPPHPAGVKLTRPGYYCIPSLDDMIGYIREDGSCVVPHLTIGRRNYGNVYYDCEVDVAGLDLDHLVHFMNKEVIVYPDDFDKPPVGEGLNRRAIVTLDRVWPRDKTAKCPITSPERLIKMDYESKLRRVCDKHETHFIEYRPETGSWVFRVEHFSKYGVTDSDEEDDTPDVLKSQLINQQKPVQTVAKPLPTGLGGSSGLGGLGGFDLQSSMVSLNGHSKGLAMDTSEENSSESHTFYPDNTRGLGVKSPTSELARLEHRRSHNVQLMKASLYGEIDMADDESISTGDQLVPQPAQSVILTAPKLTDLPMTEDVITMHQDEENVQEMPMKPLIVRPHTVVLKYHRKVPPFAKTIAGRLGASSLADMAICRARHARVGFGPRSAISVITTHAAIHNLTNCAALPQLGRYVKGRGEEDWSSTLVARLAVAGRNSADDSAYFQECMEGHLLALLKFSDLQKENDNVCPKLSVKNNPEDRLNLLKENVKESAQLKRELSTRAFGVSPSYCHEVWRLCEALWGLDLENGGVKGTNEISIVSSYRALIDWLTASVSSVTDGELSQPVTAEPEDETDSISARVWTLLCGGRVVDACRAARDAGDLNMATLVAQIGGDDAVRTLVDRQLSQWAECGALGLVSRHRLWALRLIAGRAPPPEAMEQLDWVRAFGIHARYICQQVPSLEAVHSSFEKCLAPPTGEMEPITGVRAPLPPYVDSYELIDEMTGPTQKIFDLRYELIRACANQMRPRISPANYTPDALDYSLCFLVSAWFGNPSPASVTGVAEQLEAAGAWHLAILALMYHTDDRARTHLVRSVLSRSVPAQDGSDTALQFVRTYLNLPEVWIRLAQAHRAKYEHLPSLECEHLAAAGQWNLAHKVLLENLFPDAVLADELDSLRELLEQMNSAAERNEISGWDSGGQALYHYMHVCNEIRGLVSERDTGSMGPSLGTRLEALRPRVALACRALGALPSKPGTPRVAAARAHCGARLLQLAMAAGSPPQYLAALLKALNLPPDCRAPALYKITTELAEQASENCAISCTSSPISSHKKALPM